MNAVKARSRGRLVFRKSAGGEVRPDHGVPLAQTIIEGSALTVELQEIVSGHDSFRNTGDEKEDVGNQRELAVVSGNILDAEDDAKGLIPSFMGEPAEIDRKPIALGGRTSDRTDGMAIGDLLQPRERGMAEDEVPAVGMEPIHHLLRGKLGVGAGDDAFRQGFRLRKGLAKERETLLGGLRSSAVEANAEDAVSHPGSVIVPLGSEARHEGKEDGLAIMIVVGESLLFSIAHDGEGVDVEGGAFHLAVGSGGE